MNTANARPVAAWTALVVSSLGLHAAVFAGFGGHGMAPPPAKRQTFVEMTAVPRPAPAPEALPDASEIPNERVVTNYPPAAQPGIPGPYPGRVIAVKSAQFPVADELT